MDSEGVPAEPGVANLARSRRDDDRADEAVDHVDLVTTGVCSLARLAAVADADLSGHLDDRHLDAIVGTLQAACGVPMAVVNIVTPGLQTYPAEVGVGTSQTDVPDELSPCAEVVATRGSLVIGDLTTHPVYSQNPLVQQGKIAAFAGEPLIDNGVVLGSVSVFDDQPRVFSDGELAVLRHQAQLAGAVVELRRSARTDPLTGLPNRALVFDRLALALRRLDRVPGTVAVLFLDVNDFKSVNDRHGHHCGDWLLVQLGQRLSSALRRGDTLGRFGGDEFVVVCEALSDPDDVDAIRQRFLQTLREPVDLDGHQHRISVSLGVASTTSPADTASALLRAADADMYREKMRTRSDGGE